MLGLYWKVLTTPAPFPIANPDPCHFWWKFKKIKPMVRAPPRINHQRLQVVVLPLAAAPSDSFPWQAVLFLKTTVLIVLKLMSSSFFGQNRAAWFPQTFEKTVHSHDSQSGLPDSPPAKKNLPSLKFCLASHKHFSDPPFFGSWFCWLSNTCLEKLFLFVIQTRKPSPGPSRGNLLCLAFETCGATIQRSWLRNIGHRPRAFSFKFEASRQMDLNKRTLTKRCGKSHRATRSNLKVWKWPSASVGWAACLSNIRSFLDEEQIIQWILDLQVQKFENIWENSLPNQVLTTSSPCEGSQAFQFQLKLLHQPFLKSFQWAHDSHLCW